MSLTATAVTTVYLYNGRTLQAPPSDTPMTPDQASSTPRSTPTSSTPPSKGRASRAIR